ncbi:MAG: anti-sigma factor family protein [Actinomycetota bacterium]
MNEHPEELLAEYVDDALSAGERARVEEHLSTCQQCREEVELSTSALAILASVPELEAPPGVALAVRRRERQAPSRVVRLVATYAAAAALVAAGVVVLGNLGQGDSAAPGGGGDAATGERSEAEGGGGGVGGEDPATSGEVAQDQSDGPAPALAATGPVVPTYEESDRRYRSKDLAPLARKLRDDAQAAIAAGLSPTATSYFDGFDPAAFGPEVEQAIRCVLNEIPPSQLVVPFRIEAASFEGSPAYIAAFLQGPTPDDPYDRIVIWVVHRESCSLLSLATQVL